MFKPAASAVAMFVLLSGCNSEPRHASSTPAEPAMVRRESPKASPPIAPPHAAAADGFAATVNRFCPVMQKARLSATTMVELTTEFEGETIGFCCDDCRDAWESMDDNERRDRLKTVLARK